MFFEQLKAQLETDLGLKVVLEPSHVVLKEPHIRVLPEFLGYVRDTAKGKVFDATPVDSARAGIAVHVSIPLTLVFRAFGANVGNEFLKKCLVWSLRLEKYFSLPRKLQKEWEDLGEFLLGSEALLEVRPEGQGQFFQAEEEEHKLFMFEKKFKGLLRFVIFESYEVPKVKEITVSDERGQRTSIKA